ncbi:hypothetical protein V2J09_005390 [Rumex salicifolius]
MRSLDVVVKIDPETVPPSSATGGHSSFDFEAADEFDPGRKREVSDGEFTFQRTNSGHYSTTSTSPATNAGSMEDPPSRLIGQFLEKQKVAGDMCLDMDLEMEELRHDTRRTAGLPPDNAEVVRCTSSAAFGRVPTLSRAKTARSRMMDPPPASMYDHFQSQEQHQHQHHPQTRSGQMWSGFLGGGGRIGEEATEEEDPFMEDDLPKYHRKEAISIIVCLEWTCLLLIVGALIGSLAVSTLRRTKLWRIMLWKWEVIVLVVICGRLVAGGLIKFIVLLIERNFTLRKRVLYFVYGLKKAMRNCIWLSLVLLTWHLLFGKNKNLDARHTGPYTQRLITYVTRILVCFLVGSVIWLIKTLVVKVLASSFHVNAFFERIQETLFNQFVIETLSGPPLYELHRAEEEEERTLAEIQMLQSAGAIVPPELEANVLPPATPTATVASSCNSARFLKSSTSKKQRQYDHQQMDGHITLDNLHKLDQKNVSAWKMKRLMNIVRRGALTTLDDHLDSAAHLNETSKQIRSEVEAKAAARKIFHNVARPKARFIYSEDLLRFLQEGEVLKTLSMFEKGIESERISKSALKNWVVNAFRERRALSLTLTDTKSAVIKLHRMVNILVSVIICIIWLIILDIATSQFLVFASSQVVLVAFVFGNSCKNIFESIIFLFVIHPYDVGDRVEIDTVQMVVEEMNIWTTVFLRYDNQKIIFPNYILFMKPIGNFNRSPDMGDAVEFCCHIEHWYPNPMIILKDVERFETLRIAIWLQHRMNHQDMGERWGRRALLVEECVKIFRELDIEYRVLPWNINVRNMPALSFNTAPCNWPSNPPPPNFNMGLPEGEIVHR